LTSFAASEGIKRRIKIKIKIKIKRGACTNEMPASLTGVDGHDYSMKV
jgi:hypothetical protein